MKTRILFILVFMYLSLDAQSSNDDFFIPPPPCYANTNTGFGGAVGEGSFLASDPNNVVKFNFTTSSNEMNDILVFYIDTGITGRNSIDFDVDDSADAHRIAITNSNAFGNGSVVQFPAGFEASFALAINTDFAGLWSIPATGDVGDNELNFITAVSSTLTTNNQGFYDIEFDWSDLGLAENEGFNFVATYVSPTGYSSDEGYGDGILNGTEGSDDITFNGFRSFPECQATLSVPEQPTSLIEARYFSSQLHINGVHENTRIRVYDILGKLVYSDYHEIKGKTTIPLELSKNQLYFISIQTSKEKTVLKVMPN